MPFTWDPANTAAGITLSNGNKTATLGTSGFLSTIATGQGKNSGKWYWRTQWTLQASSFFAAGFTLKTTPLTNFLGNYATGWTYYGQIGTSSSIQNNAIILNGSVMPALASNGDYIVTAFDSDNGKIYFTTMTSGGVLNTTWNQGAGASPAANVGGFSVPVGIAFLPGASPFTNGDIVTLDTATTITDSHLSGFLPYDFEVAVALGIWAETVCK